ncbi:DUF1489 family protein [Sphingomonas aracearum]|uniref:DUF1489 family protein n=1 Tax=Sphingomonas aracearum TaxID=2283317 RepID=A0A369VSR4_9SPHN|nr:DUF1489 domain-containing protein [Sphingomonas aracearum]RDE04715.1 DUF1489 family protein [Sphingomonas aracearum]
MLHLTKVAFGVGNLEALIERWRVREEDGPFALGTRYLPKRHEEVTGAGSMFWILKHQLVARSPILGFAEAEGGRTAILLSPHLVLVRPRPKRAHQGWRYLEADDAPADMGAAGEAAMLPARLAGELAELGLL